VRRLKSRFVCLYLGMVDPVCHHCHAPLEGDKPFCPACGAPQIRVNVVPAPLDRPRTASNDAAAASPAIVWSVLLPRAGLAGVISVFLLEGLGRYSALLGFLMVSLLAGIVVILYRGKLAPVPIPPLLGARIGGVTGFFCFVFNFIVAAAAVSANRQEIVQKLREQMEAAAAQQADVKQARQIIEQMLSPEGLVIIMIVSTVVFLILLIILGAAGGAVAASTRRG